ncbi:MAG: hypothetical protein UU21_C0005G0018 [Candidatus Levybacteria bacterium GW2011_GWA2_40_8]|nr:MAG: hypothetical protein UU21_C0005G0018 [Candidatus Levybacteria bacterium GW2011_GWA2_40_8]
MTGSAERPLTALEQYTSRNQGRVLREPRAALVEDIREYIRRQRALWNQIPNLALEANGRDGYLDHYSYAYHYKLWDIDDGRMAIDLKTGEILGLPFDQPDGEPDVLAGDDQVITLADEIENYDAGKIVARLKKQAQEEYYGSYNPRKIAQWRADLRAKDPFLQETLDPKLSLEGQAETLRQTIAVIEELAQQPTSELTPEQVRNTIGHVLRASDFDDRPDGTEPIEVEFDDPLLNEVSRELPYPIRIFPPPLIEIRGAQEIMQCVSFYIAPRNSQFAPLFADLSDVIWHTAVNATAKVRHERGMRHYVSPEWIYPTLGEEYVRRADGNEHMHAEPPKEPLKPDAEIGKRGIMTVEGVADWFLNTPVEEN